MTLLSGPNISGNEWKYVKDCLDTGWVSSVGSYVNKFEEMLASFTGAGYAIATSNGTTALHISLMLSGVERDDYVLVPNLTFIASVNSISYTGAKPMLVDVKEDTWQMDIDLLERFLSKSTYQHEGHCYLKNDNRRISAIMPVHVLGNMCDMDKVMVIAKKYSLTVVEDSTEALGSSYKSKHSGRFGTFGTFSFNGNKIITTGGGGMIVTDDKELAVKAKHLTTQAKADPFEYYHDEIGYNYRLVNVLAAIGVAQMEQLPAFLEKKQHINKYYQSELNGVGDISFQSVTPGTNPNYWLFTFRTKEQKKILKSLNEKGLQSRPFWVPMTNLPMYSDCIFITEANITEQVYSECLSIPCSTYITDEEMKSVVATIKESI